MHQAILELVAFAGLMAVIAFVSAQVLGAAAFFAARLPVLGVRSRRDAGLCAFAFWIIAFALGAPRDSHRSP